jgi:putative FmdB family regulatory protein
VERIVPIYEYRCTKCGHLIEIIQKLSDRPLRKCPECTGRLEKLVSRASFQLKGGGWYSEGYTSSGDKKTTTKTDPPAKSTKKDSPSSKSS